MELNKNVKTVLTGNFAYTTPCSNEHMLLLELTKSYSPIASCVLEHIITTPTLTASESLHYIFTDLKASYNLSKKGSRGVSIAAKTSSKQTNSSVSTIRRMQKSLEKKGYLEIKRGDLFYDVNNIKPTLPKEIFDLLTQSPSRTNSEVIELTNCFRSYLDSSKMFVSINYQLIDFLIKTKELTGLQKLIWIFLYIRSFLSYQSSGKRRSTITHSELCKAFKCTQSATSKALNKLSKLGYINIKAYQIKPKAEQECRIPKNVLFVEALFPLKTMESLLANQPDRAKIEANAEMINALRLKISHKLVISKTVENQKSNNSEMNDVNSEMNDVNSEMTSVNSEMTDISNKNSLPDPLFIKNTSSKNATDFDVCLKNDDSNNTSDNHNLNNNLDFETNLVSSGSKTIENKEKAKSEFIKMLQVLKGGKKGASQASNSTVNSVDPETKAKIAQELKEAQERRINNILKASDGNALQQQEISQENNVKNEIIETSTIKTLEIASANVLTKVVQQEPNDINTKNDESNDNWTFAVDIINEKFHKNVAKLTSEQVLKATNFAKKLKKEAQNLPLLRNIDENELIKQFIHHAANFKMTKLRCATRNDEVNAALNFAWNAVKQGVWAQPADWGKGMELHLRREQLRYAFDADKEVFEFGLELKKYLEAA